ncbi:hypothetical protein C2G38_2171646 [Gigaspora rosea]|uniref:Uncharacterized protein n=1 Tax=Gigaspora rosea TaxID=44941 RepID=A0A397VWA5_9GLOM|nr:hypothetical protein C2G38_2171646 [Gigaspora rosea]
MTNDDISKTPNNNILMLKYQEKAHFIIGENERQIFFLMGEYNKALDALTNNINALRYRGEIYFIIKKYDESIYELKKLLPSNK